jgi:hypothetical protein
VTGFEIKIIIVIPQANGNASLKVSKACLSTVEF